MILLLITIHAVGLLMMLAAFYDVMKVGPSPKLWPFFFAGVAIAAISATVLPYV